MGSGQLELGQVGLGQVGSGQVGLGQVGLAKWDGAAAARAPAGGSVATFSSKPAAGPSTKLQKHAEHVMHAMWKSLPETDAYLPGNNRKSSSSHLHFQPTVPLVLNRLVTLRTALRFGHAIL